jgi:UDP:flavonoid glycosyltransferase YjiC (YdhE family)
MRALFLTADLGGNVPPTLSVAEQLALRGVEVEVAGLPTGRTTLAQPPFAPAVAAAPRGTGPDPRTPLAMLRLMAGRSARERAARLARGRRADLVVVDCMLPAVLAGALDTGIPVAVLFHTVGAYWIHSFDGGAAGRLFSPLGLRPGRLWERAQARLVLTDPALDPSHGEEALRGWTWTGTTEVGAPPSRRIGRNRPRVLVTLGTTGWPGTLGLYRRIIAALAELPVDAVVTTGQDRLRDALVLDGVRGRGVVGGGGVVGGSGVVDPHGARGGAGHVEVVGWADHRAMLPETDLVIGHGGHSSTMKTLSHGVPLLVLPLNATSDQRLIGGLVENAGLGARLPARSRSARIRETVQDLLEDTALSERAARAGERMRDRAPGAAVAADALSRLMTRRG